jgi:integrase
MKERRKPGTGTVEQLPSGRRRVRVRLPSGRRESLGPFDSDVEAEAMRVAAIDELRAAVPVPVSPGGVTLRGWIPRWLDELELSKTYVAMTHIRSVAKLHLLTAPFADEPLKRITTKAIKAWTKDLVKKDAADSSLGHRLTALRKCLGAAADADLIDSNPAVGVHLPRRPARTDDPWTYLEPKEQRALATCDAIPEAWRLQITIAMGTGLRAGELFNLRLEDVRLDGQSPEIVVRYGSRKRAPKGRKIRRVPLFGVALDAARRWAELLPEWCGKNEFGLWFPGERGGFHKVSRVPGWKQWLRAAGIRRSVRWHDLRHTCAASLVSGWWGPAWSLQQVQTLLGHHSISETERYAHLAPEALRRAAQSVVVPRLAQTGVQAIEIAGSGVGPRYSPESEENQVVRTESWATLAHAARSVLEAFSAGAECSAECERLVDLVEGLPLVELARAFRVGGPSAGDAALALAAEVVRWVGSAELVRRPA